MGMDQETLDEGHSAQVPKPVEWKIEPEPVGYEAAVAFMESRVAGIRAGTESELVWLVEHPPLYTAGSSATDDELIDPEAFPVFKTGRGGRYTYHGPGQRVAYVMLDLQHRGADVRGYVRNLEAWITATLAEFGITGEPRDDRIGIWVVGSDGREAKIAAIGVRIRRWVTFHGIALNIHPNLEHFQGIIPCGIGEYGVTSMHELGVPARMSDVDAALQSKFQAIFP